MREPTTTGAVQRTNAGDSASHTPSASPSLNASMKISAWLSGIFELGLNRLFTI